VNHSHAHEDSTPEHDPARRGTTTTIVGLLLCLAFFARAAIAQAPPQPAPAEPQHDVNALAKQTQNPVADLTAVPLQFNFNSGGDLEDRSLFLLNSSPSSRSRRPRTGT
jgi:hypothetical protein